MCTKKTYLGLAIFLIFPALSVSAEKISLKNGSVLIVGFHKMVKDKVLMGEGEALV